MKTRHSELKTNDLAHWIEENAAQIKPYMPVVLGASAVVLVLLAGYGLYSSQRNARSGAAWLTLISGTGNESELERIAEQFPGTPAAAWATHAQAMENLVQGNRLLYINRDDAEKRLNDAVKGFETALQNAGQDRLLQSRASFGLAQALESQFKLDEAIKQYRKVLVSEPDGSLAEMAQRQLDRLESDSTKEFYAWFSKHRPEPPAPPTGQTPFSQPLSPLSDDLRNLPDMPDFLSPAVDTVAPPPGSESPFQPVDPADAPPREADDINSKERPSDGAPPDGAPLESKEEAPASDPGDRLDQQEPAGGEGGNS